MAARVLFSKPTEGFSAEKKAKAIYNLKHTAERHDLALADPDQNSKIASETYNRRLDGFEAHLPEDENYQKLSSALEMAIKIGMTGAKKGRFFTNPRYR